MEVELCEGDLTGNKPGLSDLTTDEIESEMERRYYKQRVIPTPRAASCQKPLRGTLSSRATQMIDGARGTLAVGKQIGPFLKMTPSCQLSGT